MSHAIHKIVSIKRCQSYFISRRSPHLGISKDSESCASAHRCLHYAYVRLIARVTFHLVTALYADAVEDRHDLLGVDGLLLFSGFVEDGFSFVHHDQAVTIFHGIAQIVGDHNSGHFLLLYDLIGELHDDLRSLGIQRSGMLIQNEKINRCHGSHEQRQCQSLSSGEGADLHTHLIFQSQI